MTKLKDGIRMKNESYHGYHKIKYAKAAVNEDLCLLEQAMMKSMHLFLKWFRPPLFGFNWKTGVSVGNGDHTVGIFFRLEATC